MSNQTTQTRTLGIIPARWGSTRFPGKPLHPIAGKPLIQHVWERCQQAKRLEATLIATETRQLVRCPLHINDAEFAAALVAAWCDIAK